MRIDKFLILLFIFNSLLFGSAVLVEKGESLGDRKVDDFYVSGHIYGVNSVAISPNGKFIVSGSGDETIKIWDIKNKKEIERIMSREENWVWFDIKNKKLKRYDKGNFLLNRDLTPFISPEINTTTQLEIKVPKKIEIDSEKVSEFEVEIENRGNQTAYWIEAISKDEDITIYPNRIMKIEPKKTIKQKIKISSFLKMENPKPYQKKIQLVFLSKYKPIATEEIEVSFKSPNLKVENAIYEKEFIKVQLKNSGNQTIKDLELFLFDDRVKKQIIKELKPNQISEPIAFYSKKYKKDINLTTEPSNSLFKWRLNNQEVIKKTLILYYIIAGVLLLILLILIYYLKRYRNPLIVKLEK